MRLHLSYLRVDNFVGSSVIECPSFSSSLVHNGYIPFCLPFFLSHLSGKGGPIKPWAPYLGIIQGKLVLPDFWDVLLALSADALIKGPCFFGFSFLDLRPLSVHQTFLQLLGVGGTLNYFTSTILEWVRPWEAICTSLSSSIAPPHLLFHTGHWIQPTMEFLIGGC